MSFTSEVKNEASKLESDIVQNQTELSALIRNIGVYNQTSLKMTTENASVARRIFSLIRDTYSITCKITVRRGYNFNRNYIYMLEITSKIPQILEDLSLTTEDGIPREYIYEDEDLKRVYLRGLFLACGSINDPKKSRYHLEFMVDGEKYAIFISKLLNTFDLNSKVLRRENKYMVYMKEAEKIGDFLRILETKTALFYYEDIRIYRDHKNMTNRLNNCEQANVDKMIETASKQVEDIQLLKEHNLLELLDEKVREVAEYRLKYPEASLIELSEIISVETETTLTKSGLYHRLKKIKEIAARVREKGDKKEKE